MTMTVIRMSAEEFRSRYFVPENIRKTVDTAQEGGFDLEVEVLRTGFGNFANRVEVVAHGE